MLQPSSKFVVLQQLSRRRQWQPTAVFLPRESRGQRSLVGCCLRGHTESDMTEVTQHACIGEGNGNPLQCSCLENPRDRGALAGCCLWGRTESDMTEVMQQHQQQQLSHVQLFCNPMDCSSLGSSVHGISQARILEWVAFSFFKRAS